MDYQFYQLKVSSDALKEFGWEYPTTFNKAKKNGSIVAVSDNQLFRTIRDIRGKVVDEEGISDLFEQRDYIKENFGKDSKEYKYIQYEINKNMYMSDIVTVIITHPSHYKYLYKNGFLVLDDNKHKPPRKFVRISCSAGQARKSTVVFCNEEVVEEVRKRLNNDRDLTKKISPNKFNAYFGLYTSGTKLVTEPRFTVIPDYENKVTFYSNWSTETSWDLDDIMEKKEITIDMNRTDGMGLISPKMAEQWSKDLRLDYTCSNFIVRNPFIKGLLTTFDFHEFCKKKNNGNYLVKTIYKDEDGNDIYKDLREVDVIISESQFKLWDSYKNVEDYVEKCHKNKLYWGVSQMSKKSYPDKLNLNYQFIQTLDEDKLSVENLCNDFVDWVKNVSYDDANKSIIYLTGSKEKDKDVKNYLTSSNDYWIKSLIVNKNIINDKYIKDKIYYYTKNRIKKGCLGEIFVDGNFQFMITDPYAYMQHVCGIEVTGLLDDCCFYSKYWNDKGIKRVDAMRSPMTYRSEHVILNLIDNDETKEWYKYIKDGIILNWYGNDVVRFSGADFDGDLLATTSNKDMINSVYTDELPVAYEAPKPNKIVPTYEDLCVADIFSFGSQIGQITNKGTIAYSLLPEIQKKYGKDSEEYNLIISRLQQGCVAQSKQIDKAKIGRAVKAIPRCWVDKQRIEEDDTEEDVRRKKILNRCLLTKRPYFFRYKYPETYREYKKYTDRNNNLCKMQWGITLDELISLEEKTEEQSSFLDNFNEFSEVIDSDSIMNRVCKYLEKEIHLAKGNIKSSDKFDYSIYKYDDIVYTESEKSRVLSILKNYTDYLSAISINNWNAEKSHGDSDDSYNCISIKLLFEDEKIDDKKILNILIDYYYSQNKSNKDILWNNYGEDIYNILLSKQGHISFPFLDDTGSIDYMGKKYKLREVC